MILYTFLLVTMIGAYLPAPTKIDPEFNELVSRFENLYGTDLKDEHIQIEFADLEYPLVGYCQKLMIPRIGLVTRRLIKIDRTHWNSYGYYEQESLLFHEALHCIADLEHDNVILEDGCPRSIMYYDYIPYSCLIEYRQKYLNEVVEAGRKRHGEDPRE